MFQLRSIAFAFAAIVLTASIAGAAEVRDFDRAAFAAALEEGRPILVKVRAWWCPVCASQGSTIRAAIASPQYDKLVVFDISYDRQKPEWQSFNVRRQGTLIAFRDGRELDRLEFVTDKDKIKSLLAQTVN